QNLSKLVWWTSSEFSFPYFASYPTGTLQNLSKLVWWTSSEFSFPYFASYPTGTLQNLSKLVWWTSSEFSFPYFASYPTGSRRRRVYVCFVVRLYLKLKKLKEENKSKWRVPIAKV
ncbi:MAG: hypothetical protein N2235_16495, partial [Fischerella sp.]|nr:hypothetical protein [Fischerella sp.]